MQNGGDCILFFFGEFKLLTGSITTRNNPYLLAGFSIGIIAVSYWNLNSIADFPVKIVLFNKTLLNCNFIFVLRNFAVIIPCEHLL